MKIFLGTDHAGFELKEAVKRWFREGGGLPAGWQVADEGAFEYVEGDDYPDFIDIVAKQVEADPENNRGIIFGGSGQGEAICANRFHRVRATVFYGGPLDILKLSREHNNANILSIGALFVKEEEAKQAIKLWLDTGFSGDDRHIRRIAKIDNKLERENFF